MAANEKRKAGKKGGSQMTRKPVSGGRSKNHRTPVRTKKLGGK